MSRRLSGNQARAMLAVALAAAHTLPTSTRNQYQQQQRKLNQRETRRLYRLNSDEGNVTPRINAAAVRRQRRAAKRYADYMTCLANNPCRNVRL